MVDTTGSQREAVFMSTVPTPQGRKIVVGVSDHPDDTQTLVWAVAEAEATRRQLVIAYGCGVESALATPGHRAGTGLLALVRPDLAHAIAEAKLRLGGDRVTVETSPVPPGELLVGLAGPDDLLVVGVPRPAGWLHRESTTHHALRHSQCPLIIVRPRPTAGAYASFEGTVAVGVDGSAASRAALRFAFDYAAEHRRVVVAVNAAAGETHDVWYDDQFLETHLTTQPASLDLLAAELEPWERVYPGVRVRRAVFTGSPVSGLLKAARGAALLVVGDRGAGRIRRVLLGSVSEAVADRADCPVAIVKARATTEGHPR
jgi:nucleotide-binding universal stress UspA family protein